MFVVDCCVDDEELDELKDSLQQSLNLLPEESLVGFITFGTMVHVHELGFDHAPKSYVFQGNKDYEPTKVQTLLGLGGNLAAAKMRMGQGSGAPAAVSSAATSRFLLPVSDCALVLESILEDLQRDPVSCACHSCSQSVVERFHCSEVINRVPPLLLFLHGSHISPALHCLSFIV